VKGPKTALPALLASFPVALIDFSDGRYESTAAYARLIQLGKHNNGELENWINSGTLPSPIEGIGETAPTPDPRMAGASTQTSEERYTAIQGSIARAHAVFQDEAKKDVTGKMRRPGVEWEFRDVFLDAAESLQERVTEITASSASQGLML
ncbi:MAG: hypothetical protein WCI34_07875, partial [Actinomycetes bacterium]